MNRGISHLKVVFLSLRVYEKTKWIVLCQKAEYTKYFNATVIPS